MAKNELKYELRDGTGKSVTRKLRKAGKIPAVVYERGQESFSITVGTESFTEIINRLRGKLLLTELIPPEGEKYLAAIKGIQRHPVTDEFLNIDFQKTHPGEMLHVRIPVTLKGTPVGLKMGGLLEHVRYEIEVRGPVSKLPLHIDIDIGDLDVGDAVRVKDLSFEEGVEVLAPPQGLVVTVIHPRKVKEVETAVEEEVTEAAEAEGETELAKEPEASKEDEAKG
ncbi:50S ribosomal protein L25 [candidate division WOR-3 bacterium]|nr:50S ribosomal protein L25 [candidate division WOR-3 bacterium]